MSNVEGKILRIYDKSKPEDEDLYDSSNWNHLAWCLVVALAAVIIWFGTALVNAENQRYALVTNQCADPLFKGAIDMQCLSDVRSRPHWWEHLWYGVTHLQPEQPASARPKR